MRTVVMVDAVPGYEAAVEARLRGLYGVRAIRRGKRGNFDLAVLLETADRGEVERWINNEARLVTGVRCVQWGPRAN